MGDIGGKYCDECVKFIPWSDGPEKWLEERSSNTWCSSECHDLWMKKRPLEAAQWTPMSDCFPGGKNDGLLEENGFFLNNPTDQ